MAEILVYSASGGLPALIQAAGGGAAESFLEYFAARIRNVNTREAYLRASAEFLSWCADQPLELAQIKPVHVAAYVELLGREKSKSTVKQSLAAVRTLFDHLVSGRFG